MDTSKYLPIGTVVMLKGGTKRVMITGFCSIEENTKEKVKQKKKASTVGIFKIPTAGAYHNF